MDPIIFLDFDGVLNDQFSFRREPFGDKLYEELVEKIVSVAKKLNAKVVVTSAWRIVYELEEIYKLGGARLKEVMHEDWKVGHQHGLRGECVAEWLDKHGWRPYVCVDDSHDYYRWQPFVHVPGREALKDEHIAEIILLMGEQIIGDGVRNPYLRFKRGDMLNSPDVIVAHGCNAQGAMGSGAALAVIKRYPKNKEVYVARHQRDPLKLGEVVWHYEHDKIINNSRLIANCITQEFAGYDGKQYVDYDAIKTSYTEVCNKARVNGWKSISTCMVGAVLGGGDWNVICNILETVGKNTGVTITIFILPNERAETGETMYHRTSTMYRENTLHALFAE